MYVLIGLARSTALYLFAWVLVNVFVHRMDPSNLLWPAGLYLGLLVLHVVIVKIGILFGGEPQSLNELVGALIYRDVTNPFSGLVAIARGRRVIDTTGFKRMLSWGGSITHFIWATALWIFLFVTLVLPLLG